MLYGKASPEAYDSLTKEITRMFGTTLSIPAEGIYVKYEETEHWGWNGENF